MAVQSPGRPARLEPAPDPFPGPPSRQAGVDLPWWATSLLTLVAITAGTVASVLTGSPAPFVAAAVMVVALLKWQGPFPHVTIGRDGQSGPRA